MGPSHICECHHYSACKICRTPYSSRTQKSLLAQLPAPGCDSSRPTCRLASAHSRVPTSGDLRTTQSAGCTRPSTTYAPAASAGGMAIASSTQRAASAGVRRRARCSGRSSAGGRYCLRRGHRQGAPSARGACEGGRLGGGSARRALGSARLHSGVQGTARARGLHREQRAAQLARGGRERTVWNGRQRHGAPKEPDAGLSLVLSQGRGGSAHSSGLARVRGLGLGLGLGLGRTGRSQRRALCRRVRDAPRTRPARRAPACAAARARRTRAPTWSACTQSRGRREARRPQRLLVMQRQSALAARRPVERAARSRPRGARTRPGGSRRSARRRRGGAPARPRSAAATAAGAAGNVRQSSPPIAPRGPRRCGPRASP